MRSRSVVLGLLFSFIPLSNVGFLEGQAEARPIRRPGVHALLLDLAQIEAFNGERDDHRTGQQIHQQIIAVRINLLRTLADQERFHTGGRAAMEGLFNMALLNNRSFDRDPEVVWRIAGSIEHMRQRLEQLMTRHGQYRPVPVPRDYRVPSGYQPPVYRGPIWDPFQGGYMPTFPGQGPQQVLPLINRSRNRHRRLHTSLFRLCTNTHRNNINPLCTNRHRPLFISRRRNLNLLCTNRHRLRIPIRIRRLIQWTLGSLRSSFRG